MIMAREYSYAFGCKLNKDICVHGAVRSMTFCISMLGIIDLRYDCNLLISVCVLALRVLFSFNFRNNVHISNLQDVACLLEPVGLGLECLIVSRFIKVSEALSCG